MCIYSFIWFCENEGENGKKKIVIFGKLVMFFVVFLRWRVGGFGIRLFYVLLLWYISIKMMWIIYWGKFIRRRGR